jgi:hypothetical protein
LKETSSGKSAEKKLSKEDMADVVARARKTQEESLKGYREQSLRLHPWICARCGREFTNKNLHMLTVHHIDHDHENNPGDGSNWENLCIYCHDNEHRRFLDYLASDGIISPDRPGDKVTHKPFAALANLLNKSKE